MITIVAEPERTFVAEPDVKEPDLDEPDVKEPDFDEPERTSVAGPEIRFVMREL